MTRAIFGVIVFAAGLMAGLTPALADQCTDKLFCNDPAFPKCAFNPSRGEWKCIGRNAVFCASPHRSYTCQPGQRCNGDGSAAPFCR